MSHSQQWSANFTFITEMRVNVLWMLLPKGLRGTGWWPDQSRCSGNQYKLKAAGWMSKERRGKCEDAGGAVAQLWVSGLWGFF